MDGFEVTKMGERGQVVIPQEFRKRMKLSAGEKFVVIAHDDTLILKRLIAPSLKDFEFMLGKAHSHARKHGITESEMQNAIGKVRKKK